MAVNFQTFLEGKVPSEIAVVWEGAVIKQVDVLRARKMWRMVISVPRPIPFTDISETAERIRRCDPFLEEVDLLPQIQHAEKNLVKILHDRRDDLSSFLSSRAGISFRLSDDDMHINGARIDILAGEKKLYEQYLESQVCTYFAEWFWSEYKWQVVVRVVSSGYKISQPKEVFITEQKVETIEFAEEQNYSQNAGRKIGHRRGRKLREAKINDIVIPIIELQEGMEKAASEGKVWYKEVNELRGGRFVISYYITDYTDTVVAKAFMDSAEEDTINVGDWVKVKGSMRFDPFLKEVALFLEQYCQEEPKKRLDQSERKRIELHAHTKMSAMDALTEISDLIDRAAEWGHSAIAITDHGGVQAFPIAHNAAKKHDIKIIYGVEGYLIQEDKKEKPYHIILLAQNTVGLRNMYYLISHSYLDYFYRSPKMPRNLIESNREGLLLGTACEAGELYQAILNGSPDEELEKIAGFYDYLEIQPNGNNMFLIRKGIVSSENELNQINRRIVALGKKIGKPVVATGDVHFLDPHHESYRRIIQAGQGYTDAEEPLPLFFKSTDEMLKEFSYLGDQDARWVVIDSPQAVSDQIEKIQPVPDGFYPPKIDSAEEEVIALTWQRAHDIYGSPLPDVVEKRTNRELDSIVKHGFSVLYLIAHKLVKKSNEDGYLVGSRGSVGSSMVAYFTGITEVNALPPHYICPNCKFSEFILDGSVGAGVDLPDKKCPNCEAELYKNGFEIPFETFLGFDGDKVPDIDLNFSGDYQARAHHYVEELFGTKNVFKAGTISTVAEKTAYGFVKKYAEGKQLQLRGGEMKRLAAGITGVRRTTGQHPGGMIVVPHDRNILEFTPIQHPADNKDSGIITTHFEYHSIGDQLVKLDILGHDDPTVIKALEDATGVNAQDISLSDKETMRLFSSVEPLGVTEDEIYSTVGTYGIPEFGTKFVRQMLEATRPTTFSELVRISGLSHGTDVWLNNAQTLIQNKTANLSEVICTRDDIMTYLILKNMEKKQAFKSMENVRKGRGLKNEEVEMMQACDVPEWYIDSCQKIKYMFPKAHAVAYVTMAFRIAWFKVNYPLAFYAAFFSIRAEDFDAETILGGYQTILNRIKEIEGMGQTAPQKEKKLLIVLELALELYARGFVFLPVNLYQSDAKYFKVMEQGLILPFSALPNVGAAAAQGIVECRKDGEFVSIEDFQNRSRLNKTAMDMLRKEGCFSELPESTQMSLFG
ncbi:MAG: PolC-type DNA polymerase III [Bacillota bacterium]|nr:PolC-type DNA polymerase III [Bacillota bacterium]